MGSNFRGVAGGQVYYGSGGEELSNPIGNRRTNAVVGKCLLSLF